MSGRPMPETEPVDPALGRRPARASAAHPRVLAAIALGGMAGASARHALELVWPTAASGFPWATLVTNASGCLLIGVVMVWVVEAGGAHPLVRPFLGVGVLGGYTTFSTYAVQTHALLRADRPGLALAYLLGTLLAATVGAAVGVAAARGVLRLRGTRRYDEEAR